MEAEDEDLDFDFAFNLQMQEAINASATLRHLSPSSSSSTPPQFHLPNDDVSDPTVATLLADEIARFEQERADREQAEAEMRRIRDDLDRRVHDQAFALELSRIADDEWAKTGNHFVRPYGEASSSSATAAAVAPDAEAFRLYFKGLLREETVGGVKKTSASIGVAICDFGDDRLFEMRKPLIGGGGEMMSGQAAEVKALIEGLDAALSLGIKRIIIYCDDGSLHQFVTGKSVPKEGNIATLVDHVTLLARKFSYCGVSLVRQEDIKFALQLAREVLVSQVARPEKFTSGKDIMDTCPICFEDAEVGDMFSVDGCQHRYCSYCMKKHVEVKLLQGKLPKCPHVGCNTDLKTESCKKFLTSELCNIMTQRVKEYSIPTTEKFYCPYPKCSALMSKVEVVTNTHFGVSICKGCNGPFCMNCNVVWHNNMSCSTYKNSNPYPCAEDAMLKSLATKNLWRQCVKCSHMVELAEGCNHIYCRCGYEFCYICGAVWKNKKATCACPLWDEKHIVYGQPNGHQQRQG